MDRARKEQQVAVLRRIFSESALVVLTRQQGLTVAETTVLRGQMREAGAAFRVVKNRLAKLALADTAFTGIADMFSGPTAIACSTDPVAAARVVVAFARGSDKLTVVGGAMQGVVLDAAGVDALARLPSLDTLRGKLAGVLQAPAGKLAAVLQAPAGQLARVMRARADDQAAAGPPTPDAA